MIFLNIGICVNGKREECLKELLMKEHEVTILNEQNLVKMNFDVLIFGIRTLDVGISFGTLVMDESVWNKIDRNTRIVCGKASTKIKANYSTLCLLEVETFLNENARITAYGILYLLLENCPRLILEKKVDVIGYGHCGKEIVKLLEQLGITVRVVVNKVVDINTVKILYEDWKYVEPYDVIINTAPLCVIDEYFCGRWLSLPMILDLSSGHVGVSDSIRMCLTVIDAPPLPERIGYVSAGEGMFQAIQEWLI